MIKKVYQVHYISSGCVTVVSEDENLNGKVTGPQTSHLQKYVVSNSLTGAKLKAFPHRTEDDEVYALEVSEETLKCEIMHCKELIAYWNGKSEEIKSKEKVNECIIPRQQNLIKHYENILKELKND